MGLWARGGTLKPAKAQLAREMLAMCQQLHASPFQNVAGKVHSFLHKEGFEQHLLPNEVGFHVPKSHESAVLAHPYDSSS